MLRTNSKQYLDAIEAYITECLQDIDSDHEFTTKGALTYAFDRFEKEANYRYNVARYPVEQDRLADYLMGLPFQFDFANYDILQVAERLHGCKLTEAQEDKILENWWHHLAFHMLRMRDKYLPKATIIALNRDRKHANLHPFTYSKDNQNN